MSSLGQRVASGPQTRKQARVRLQSGPVWGSRFAPSQHMVEAVKVSLSPLTSTVRCQVSPARAVRTFTPGHGVLLAPREGSPETRCCQESQQHSPGEDALPGIS